MSFSSYISAMEMFSLLYNGDFRAFLVATVIAVSTVEMCKKHLVIAKLATTQIATYLCRPNLDANMAIIFRHY